MRARTSTAGSPRSPWVARCAWALTVVAVGASGFVAGRATLAPPTADLGAGPAATTTVATAAVGRNLPTSVFAAWTRSPLGGGAATGTLTSITVADGDEVTAGDLLYTVDLRPVVVAEGPVPSFRALSLSAQGADVTQLQSLLVHQTHLREGSFTPGKFDNATDRAVRAWQKTLGVSVDGIVAASDILYTPTLPARVARTPETVIGAQLSPELSVLEAMSTDPVLRAAIPQDSNILTGTELELLIGDAWLPVVVTAIEVDANDQSRTYAILGATDSTVLCGTGCDIATAANGTVLRGRQVIIPEAEGPAVPVAAVRTDNSGATYLLAADGTRIDVTVQAHGDGRAVLSGVDVGTVVQLPEAPTA